MIPCKNYRTNFASLVQLFQNRRTEYIKYETQENYQSLAQCLTKISEVIDENSRDKLIYLVEMQSLNLLLIDTQISCYHNDLYCKARYKLMISVLKVYFNFSKSLYSKGNEIINYVETIFNEILSIKLNNSPSQDEFQHLSFAIEVFAIYSHHCEMLNKLERQDHTFTNLISGINKELSSIAYCKLIASNAINMNNPLLVQKLFENLISTANHCEFILQRVLSSHLAYHILFPLYNLSGIGILEIDHINLSNDTIDFLSWTSKQFQFINFQKFKCQLDLFLKILNKTTNHALIEEFAFYLKKLLINLWNSIEDENSRNFKSPIPKLYYLHIITMLMSEPRTCELYLSFKLNTWESLVLSTMFYEVDLEVLGLSLVNLEGTVYVKNSDVLFYFLKNFINSCCDIIKKDNFFNKAESSQTINTKIESNKHIRQLCHSQERRILTRFFKYQEILNQGNFDQDTVLKPTSNLANIFLLRFQTCFHFQSNDNFKFFEFLFQLCLDINMSLFFQCENFLKILDNLMKLINLKNHRMNEINQALESDLENLENDFTNEILLINWINIKLRNSNTNTDKLKEFHKNCKYIEDFLIGYYSLKLAITIKLS